MPKPSLIDAVATGLQRAGHAFSSLAAMPGFGVAHDHVRVHGFGGTFQVLARVPRAPFARLSPERSLGLQAAAFMRAEPSQHVPRLVGLLAPSEHLPVGALIVEEILGQAPRLKRDYRRIAYALAQIHALPLPKHKDRPPLPDPRDPVLALLETVEEQSRFLEPAGAAPALRAAVASEIELLRAWVMTRPAHDKAFVLCDAHPGNFVVAANRQAVAVDLEKGQYGLPAVDLAHATLATSTLWDPACADRLTQAQLVDFHAYYLRRLRARRGAPMVKAMLPLLSPIRRLVWIRTTTWMARFKAGGGLDRPSPFSEHIGRYLDWVLSAAAAEEIREEWLALPSLADQLKPIL